MTCPFHTAKEIPSSTGYPFPWTKENSCHHRGIRLGKTTVLRAVGHILPRQGQVTGGHILFEGKESETKTIREKTSFIFQDSGAMLNPIRTIGTEFSEYPPPTASREAKRKTA